MDKFKILIEGYARMEDGEVFASPTSILVYSNEKKVLIDPGANKDLLLKALESEGLKPEDIDIVFLTHYHPDHFLNIRLFPDKPIYDYETIFVGDRETFFKGNIPGTNIESIQTPGHAYEHSSPIIKTEEGVYVVAMDVFWWMDGEQKEEYEYNELVNLEDPYAKDMETLKESRTKVLEIADWIIPGHGKVFKNKFKK